jgi:hypothetical protein
MTKIKSIFGVFLVVGFVYLAFQLLPPYAKNYQFQQDIQSIARNNEYTPVDEKGIRDLVRREIVDDGVPINPDSVVITKANSDVTIGAQYSVHVDLPFHPVDLTFSPATKNGEPIGPLASTANQ